MPRMEAAKIEVIAGLDTLETADQFQIVFYNETPKAFNPAGEIGKLAFATEQNKEWARRFIGSITGFSGREDEASLKFAILMQTRRGILPQRCERLTTQWASTPRDPALRGRNSDQHHRSGIGPKQGGDNFLFKLARENGRQYGYRDVAKYAGDAGEGDSPAANIAGVVVMPCSALDSYVRANSDAPTDSAIRP